MFIRHPQFEAVFDHNSRTLECDDEQVLADFELIIKQGYGTYLTKEEAFRLIRMEKFEGASVIKAGVCYYKDRPWSGWDGTLNAIWADSAPPGKIINVYYSWSFVDSLHNFLSLSDEDIARHQDKNAIVRSMIMRKATHPEDAVLVDERIKGVISASKSLSD